MDIVSHVIEGTTRFQAYSFDVLFEKGGAERFMDLTTSNHSNTGTADDYECCGRGHGGSSGGVLQSPPHRGRQNAERVERGKRAVIGSS